MRRHVGDFTFILTVGNAGYDVPISSSTLRCTSAGSTTTYESGILKSGSSNVATVPSRFIVTRVSSVQVLRAILSQASPMQVTSLVQDVLPQLDSHFLQKRGHLHGRSLAQDRPEHLLLAANPAEVAVRAV